MNNNKLEILNTTELNFNIEKLLKSAKKYLLVCTPYLKLNPRLKLLLNSIQVKTLFVYRKYDHGSVSNLLNNEKIELIQNEYLHAKIYMNESHAIISSLNLYDYSQVNNHEIGVLLAKENFPDKFDKLLEEVGLIVKAIDPTNEWVEENAHQYLMRSIYQAVMEKYGLKRPTDGSDEVYEKICDFILKKYKFRRDELYRDDESMILRSSEVPSSIYREVIDNFKPSLD